MTYSNRGYASIKANTSYCSVACSLTLEELMPSKSIILSNYSAKCSGILPRVNMPHFQCLSNSLDF